MTTQQATDENVPRWFVEFLNEFGRFREENERQHRELADRISATRIESGGQFASLGVQIAELRGEFRSLKTIGIVIASSGAVLTAAAVTAVARYVLGG